MIKTIYTSLIFLIIMTNTSYATTIDYYDFKCIGVLRIKDSSFLANWEIKFINASSATLDFFYGKKKRSANLRIDIQKNQDFYANGKWRSRTDQGPRFLSLEYTDTDKKILLGGTNAQFRAEGKCIKNNN
mgnify:CR=1 FL=1